MRMDSPNRAPRCYGGWCLPARLDVGPVIALRGQIMGIMAPALLFNQAVNLKVLSFATLLLSEVIYYMFSGQMTRPETAKAPGVKPSQVAQAQQATPPVSTPQ